MATVGGPQHTGAQGSAPPQGGAAQGFAPPQGGAPRSRRRWILAVARCTAALLLLFAATVGGIAYLVMDRRADEASRTTYTTERYSFEHPVEWTPPSAPSPTRPEQQTLELGSADGTRYVTVLDFQGAQQADAICESNEELIHSQGLDSVSGEVVGERDVDGRTAIHHRAAADGLQEEHPASVLDTFCVQRPDGVTMIVLQHLGEDTSIGSMPELEGILGSWNWLPDTEE